MQHFMDTTKKWITFVHTELFGRFPRLLMWDTFILAFQVIFFQHCLVVSHSVRSPIHTRGHQCHSFMLEYFEKKNKFFTRLWNIITLDCCKSRIAQIIVNLRLYRYQSSAGAKICSLRLIIRFGNFLVCEEIQKFQQKMLYRIVEKLP